MPIVTNGEKQKDVMPGWIVALIKLVNPKTNPNSAPAFFPNTIPAIMTGMCIVVAFNGSIGIYPRGVTTRMISIAKNKAIEVMYCVFFDFI